MHLPPGDEAILFLDCFATSWLAMTGLVDLLITLDCYDKSGDNGLEIAMRTVPSLVNKKGS